MSVSGNLVLQNFVVYTAKFEFTIFIVDIIDITKQHFQIGL